MPFNGIGNLLCIYCKAEMKIVVVEADKGINRYSFECYSCERIRVIEIAPKLPSYEVNNSL